MLVGQHLENLLHYVDGAQEKEEGEQSVIFPQQVGEAQTFAGAN